MQFVGHYTSPLGEITLASDGYSLTGAWLEGQKNFGSTLIGEVEEQPSAAIDDARRWLDVYFSGRNPDFFPRLRLIGSEFRRRVWQLLLRVPYGATTTYGTIANALAKERGVSSVSAQAVGNAVGHNPLLIFVPCHRVVGATGSLTGYAAGIDRKRALLRLEGTFPVSV